MKFILGIAKNLPLAVLLLLAWRSALAIDPATDKVVQCMRANMPARLSP